MEANEETLEATGLVSVRATVHLPGLQPGDEVYVDPSDPYMADLLAGRLLDDGSPGPVADSPA